MQTITTTFVVSKMPNLINHHLFAICHNHHGWINLLGQIFAVVPHHVHCRHNKDSSFMICCNFWYVAPNFVSPRNKPNDLYYVLCVSYFVVIWWNPTSLRNKHHVSTTHLNNKCFSIRFCFSIRTPLQIRAKGLANNAGRSWFCTDLLHALPGIII